jgi:hypothetical protein
VFVVSLAFAGVPAELAVVAVLSPTTVAQAISATCIKIVQQKYRTLKCALR